MDSDTYLQASARTASTQFHDDKVSADLLYTALQHAINTGNQLDQIKKSLFYGQDLPTDHAWLSDADSSKQAPKMEINPDIVHAAIGLYTEATELLEGIRDSLEGKPYDAVNAFEECGDAEWYLAMLYRALGRTPKEARSANIAKLTARYPEKFTGEKAINRDIEQERSILEQAHQK